MVDPAPARADAFLDRPATMADVIAWIVAVPTVGLGAWVVPMAGNVIPKFKTAFDALHARLPPVTVVVLAASQYGWIFFNLLPCAVVAAMVVMLVRAKTGGEKIGVVAAAALFIALLLGTLVVAIAWPWIELQKQLA
jgi:type II secretory pathway component PulF